MKKILLFALMVTALSCSRKAKNPPPAPTEITSDTIVTVTSDNAKNSLDYLGIYKGKLPCADCAEIETTLQLSEGFSYTLQRTYLGKQSKVEEKKGAFKWNEAGNAIILDNLENEPNQYFVGENSLTQLDLNGGRVTGKLASSYVLNKLSEAQAVKTDAPAKIKQDIFTGTKWRLVELNGRKVASKGERELGIEFRADHEFTAYAGCNSIGGKFEYNDSKIKLFNVFATRMACQEMQDETDLIKAFETTDNYVRNEKVLQLRIGGKILAKFDAIN